MSPALEPYASRLRADLAALKAELDGLLDRSTIQAVNADPMFITASNWRWGRSDSALTAARMSLLSRYISWFDRFRLLFPEPTRDISSKTGDAEEFVQRWLSRDKAFDHSIPQTIEQAKQKAARELAVLDDLIEIAAEAGDKTLRVVPDTNALIRNPAVEDIATVVGSANYVVHIPTTVLSELDDLKDRGRTPNCARRLRRSSAA